MNWSFLFALALMVTGSGCDDLVGTAHEVDRSDVAAVSDRWVSGPWLPTDPERDGLIKIPPDERLRLFHGLGREPRDIRAYVGFSVDGGKIMPATGNAVEIMDVTAEYIEVRNRSGGSFFYRFVLD